MDSLLKRLLPELETRMEKKQPFLLAIDGRCAAGKTTLGEQLKEKLSCTVIHMDEFFLRPEQRTPERLSQPGENVDHERFLEEVLLPLQEGRSLSYRPYDCAAQSLKAPVMLNPKGLVVIEGSYSCHPALREYYDLRLFLTVNPQEQLRRLALRCPEKLQMFQDRWIPLEERYFQAFDLENRCELVFDTSK